MKLPIVVVARFLLYGVAGAKEGPALAPMSLHRALSAKPERADLALAGLSALIASSSVP